MCFQWCNCFMCVFSGLIGRSWAMVFLGGGYRVKIYDNQPGQAMKAAQEVRSVGKFFFFFFFFFERDVLCGLEWKPIGREISRNRDGSHSALVCCLLRNTCISQSWSFYDSWRQQNCKTKLSCTVKMSCSSIMWRGMFFSITCMWSSLRWICLYPRGGCSVQKTRLAWNVIPRIALCCHTCPLITSFAHLFFHRLIQCFPTFFVLCTPWAYLSYHEYPHFDDSQKV